MKHSKLYALCCSLVLLLSISHVTVAEVIYFNGSDTKAGFYIVPKNMPSDGAKVWVMVDVHGAGGLKSNKSTSPLIQLVAPEPVIVIVPSFTSGYQAGNGVWAKQLLSNFKTVQKSHPTHDKMFIHGHSGGGQFSHRFAFSEPSSVIGISAHSSGSWATGGQFSSIATKAKNIPFTISCGEQDTAVSVPGYPHNRISWFKLFSSTMEKKGFTLATQTWPNTKHGVSSKLYGPQLKECFLLATKGTMPTSKLWTGDVEKMAEKARKKYPNQEDSATNKSSLSYSHQAAIKSISQATNSTVKPNQLEVLQFLAKHPASLWAGNPEYNELKEFCKNSAQNYIEERKSAAKPLSGNALRSFKRATDGLEITF